MTTPQSPILCLVLTPAGSLISADLFTSQSRLDQLKADTAHVNPEWSVVARDVMDLTRLEALRNALTDLLPFAESYWDEGPPGMGWQSKELVSAIAIARNVLASLAPTN